MKKIIITLISVFTLISLISCGGGGTQYKDAAQDKGSITWGPKEIKSTVDKMVTSLYAYLKDDWGKATFIENRPIRNKTSEHIDTKMVTNEIVTNLIKKRIYFIDKDVREDTIKEIEMGLTGLIDPDSAVPLGELKSPNFYLYGDISENMRYVGGKQLQYLVVTLQLTQLRTGMVMWQDQKEFLKSTATKRVSF